MSYFKDKLIEKGFEDLVILSSDRREEVTGFNDEHIKETVVARKEEEFYSIQCYALIRVFKGTEYKFMEQPITEERYIQLVNSRASQDK